MTTMQSAALAAYQGNAIGTATPGQLLVMLVDRMVLDVERGLHAQMSADWQGANRELQHAQAIATQLQVSLDPEGWTGGPELMALYGYIQRRLVDANVHRDQIATEECLTLCRELADTWRTAALLAAQE